jgi:heparinase II/III-like protein
MIEGLYHHGLHLENNLSFYFSPNTHLLGEAVALHVLAALLPGLPHAAKWKQKADGVVQDQMKLQVRDDGSHFEQSTYYHVYALDMFLFHAALSNQGSAYKAKLARMADYLDALLGPDRRLPFLGDDDGGRWFHPYGDRDRFGRATLATANSYFKENRWTAEESDYWEQACWWLPDAHGERNSRIKLPARSQLFADVGLAILRSSTTKIIVDCGTFGRGSAGHSHADTLNVTVTAGEEEILIDPGTFTYVGSTEERNAFRGTAAHNTIRVDARDQADPVNTFRWAGPPAVSVLVWRTSEAEDILEAECYYRGLRHRRYVHFIKPFALLIVDTVDGPPGDHLLEQYWHFASDSHVNRLRVPSSVQQRNGWRSLCFGQRDSVPVLVVAARSTLPAIIPAAIRLSEQAEIDIAVEQGVVRFTVTITPENRRIIVNYPPDLR